MNKKTAYGYLIWNNWGRNLGTNMLWVWGGKWEIIVRKSNRNIEVISGDIKIELMKLCLVDFWQEKLQINSSNFSFFFDQN